MLICPYKKLMHNLLIFVISLRYNTPVLVFHLKAGIIIIYGSVFPPHTSDRRSIR